MLTRVQTLWNHLGAQGYVTGCQTIDTCSNKINKLDSKPVGFEGAPRNQWDIRTHAIGLSSGVLPIAMASPLISIGICSFQSTTSTSSLCGSGCRVRAAYSATLTPSRKMCLLRFGLRDCSSFWLLSPVDLTLLHRVARWRTQSLGCRRRLPPHRVRLVRHRVCQMDSKESARKIQARWLRKRVEE